MIGRDFSHVGLPTGIFSSYGDGHGFPYKGAIKPVFMDNSTVAVLDDARGIHVQRLGGLSYYLCAPPANNAKLYEQEDNEDYDSDASDTKVTEDIRYIDIIPCSICSIPTSENMVAVADVNCFIKMMARTTWTTDCFMGGIGTALGKFARISDIKAFEIEGDLLFCVSEVGNQRIQIVDEYCNPVVSIAGVGVLPGQFREPTSIAVYVDNSNVKKAQLSEAQSALKALQINKPSLGSQDTQLMSPKSTIVIPSIKDAKWSSGTGFNLQSPGGSRQSVGFQPSKGGAGNSSSTTGQPAPAVGHFGRQFSGKFKANANINNSNSNANTTGFNSTYSDIKPSWYYGICMLRDLKSRIARKMAVGSYALGKRHDDHSLYDFVYVAQPHKATQPVFEHIVFRVRETDGRIFNCTEEEAGTADPNGYRCIWEAIRVKYSKVLRHDTDPRPFVSIAVADKGNRRVQILKFYYSLLADIYSPNLEYFATIGGVAHTAVELKEPTSVAYTGTGELVICDAVLKKIFILSKRFNLICTLSIGFEMTRNQFQMVSYSRPSTRDGRGNSNQHSENGFGSRPTTRQASIDYRINSVSVSTDGKLAIGFQCGGLLVYKSYKSYQLGVLELVPTTVFLSILEYCDYHDFEGLRTTCRYLHNFTRTRRNIWAIYGMRTEYCPRSVYAYIKWAKTVDGMAGLSSLIACKDIHDQGVCQAHLELRCSDKYCRKSHQMPAYDYSLLTSCKDYALDLTSLNVIISFIFTSTFLWKNEFYIKELFTFYCVTRKICVKTDPMTRHNEVIRSEHYERVPAILFTSFMTIMAVLEEDYRGLKPLLLHPLFKSHAFQKKKSALMDDIRKQVPESLKEVSLRHDMMAEKYPVDINVPPTARQVKRFRCLPGMQYDYRRGKHQTEVEHHIQTVELLGDRASDLLSKLFS